MEYIIGIIGTALGAIWVLFFLKGLSSKRYATYIGMLNGNAYKMKDLYVVGFSILDTFKNKCDKGFWAKNIDKMDELYGTKKAVFYNYAFWAGKISVAFTISIIGIFLGMIAKEPAFSVIGLFLGPFVGFAMGRNLEGEITEKREQMLMELPQILSKMAMLIKAGMTAVNAWNTVATSNEGALYYEMKLATMEMQKGGVTFEKAYTDFANRCVIPEVRKFASLMIQCVKLGPSEMEYALMEMVDDRWQQKKTVVLRKGELAGNKLLIPIMLMFLGVMILIMVPVFTQMGGA